MGRVMAVDYGERRVGVALSDETRLIATPLDTLDRREIRAVGKKPEPERDLAGRLCEIAAANEVDTILIGLPLNMDGSAGETSKKVLRFVKLLKSVTEIEVVKWDERLSSVSAEKALLEMGLPKMKRRQKERVDQLAAVIMLQSYLRFNGR